MQHKILAKHGKLLQVLQFGVTPTPPSQRHCSYMGGLPPVAQFVIADASGNNPPTKQKSQLSSSIVGGQPVYREMAKSFPYMLTTAIG